MRAELANDAGQLGRRLLRVMCNVVFLSPTGGHQAPASLVGAVAYEGWGRRWPSSEQGRAASCDAPPAPPRRPPVHRDALGRVQ